MDGKGRLAIRADQRHHTASSNRDPRRPLETEPVKQGEPLKYALSGLYSTPVARRYLLIYEVKEDEPVVIVHAVGIHRQGERSDVYNLIEPD